MNLPPITASVLNPSARQALDGLADALNRAHHPADGPVLLVCSATDLAALDPDGNVPAAIAQLTAADQAVMLPALAGSTFDPSMLARVVAGRRAYEIRNPALLRQLALHLPANTPVDHGGRQFVRATPATAPQAGAMQPATWAVNPPRAHDFAMHCKSYRGDLLRAQVLVETFNRHNRDGLTLYLSCPSADLELFAPLAGNQVQVLADESFAEPFQTREPMNGMSVGYVNQQICKLTFYRTGLADNYLCLDSDTVFIRDFQASDFMHSAGIPYTVLVQDKDLSIERHYRDVHWVGRQQSIARIYKAVGLDDRRLRTCHNGQVFNAAVLASLHDEFMRGRGLDYIELLRLGSYEFTWYNAWFQTCRLVPEVAVEPFFKMLHMRPEYILSRVRMLREEDYAQAYVGLILNSKWRPTTPLRYADPTPAHAALYATLLQDEESIERLRLQPMASP